MFWGEATTASSKDPNGMYSVQVIFPEKFSDNSYFCVSTLKLLQANTNPKWDTAVNYYGRTKEYMWIGSSEHTNTTFSWFAIGY